MSGILSCIKRNIRKLVIFIIMSLEVLCICVGMYALGICFLILAVLNGIAIHKMNCQRKPFDARSLVRNVDYLIIGDMCHANDVIPEGKMYVQIMAPNRGLASSYEILRHTYSILKEKNGSAVLVCRDKYDGKEKYSLFDMPFFIGITCDRLHLKALKWKCYFPIIFEPLNTIRFLLGIRTRGWMTTECPLEEIKDFCTERDIQLIYKYK